MEAVTLSDARAALVKARALEGVRSVLERGDPLTFASVAAAAGVPERTLYRHFPTREALLSALFDWANQQVGFAGERASDASGFARQVRLAFPGFDAIAPVIRELLSAPEGRRARAAHNRQRQGAALALVQREGVGLDATSARRVAAVMQLLTSASAWQALHDHWDMDGAEAAEASVLAAELILEAARARSKGTGKPNSKRRGATPRKATRS
jgi:AcrR family transcriptional regulator